MFLDKQYFDESVKDLIGLTISKAYNSYGSSLCMELGEITLDDRNREKGDAYIRLDWDWRLEDDESIICGSSNHRPKIAETAENLTGLTISNLVLYGSPPEIEIHLSNNQRLRSMAMLSGYPQWTIRLKDNSYLSNDLDEGMTDKEQEYSKWTEVTAKRWGRPELEPVCGRCSKCLYFVRIDGNYHLLDYGVCSFGGGPFDGRVVMEKSGCPEYVER